MGLGNKEIGRYICEINFNNLKKGNFKYEEKNKTKYTGSNRDYV